MVKSWAIGKINEFEFRNNLEIGMTSMKKYISYFIILWLLIGLSGCQTSQVNISDNDPSAAESISATNPSNQVPTHQAPPL